MKSISFIKHRWFIAYYTLILMALFFFLLKYDVHFSPIQRTLLLGFIVIPVFFKLKILPSILLLFCGISSQSFTAILPSNNIYIIILTLVCYSIYNNKSNTLLVKEFIIVGIFFSIALLHLDVEIKMSWIIIAILLSDMINTKDDLYLLLYAFVSLSFFWSFLYLILWNDFAGFYQSTNIKYLTWTNHNVFGATVAAGSSLASAYTIGILKLKKTLFLSILSAITMIISFFTLILNASRGAFMAFTIPTLFMILISEIRLHTKLIISLVSIVFLTWILNSNLFDLLIYRIGNDETKTGGRTIIWATKLNLFMLVENPLQLLGGIGQTACFNLGKRISTHNDFVTALIAYGVIGLFLFVYSFFVYPIKMAGRNEKIAVASLLTYLFVECSVLEPIFRGYFVEIMFFFFVMKYTLITAQETTPQTT